MKHHIYIFDEHSRASIYGIGSYIRQLQSVFAGNREVELCVFVLCSLQEEYRMERKNNCRYIYIPANGKMLMSNTYYIHVSYLLKREIVKGKNKYFICNYHQHLYWINWIRSNYLDNPVFFVVHCQKWALKMNGNRKYFQYVNEKVENKILVSNMEQDIYETYLREKEVYDNVDKVICLCGYTYEFLLSIYSIKV